MSSIILDACNNHLGNTDIIREMIKQAKTSGADYIKFQAFDVEKLNMDEWGHRYDFYKSCQLSDSQYAVIMSLCANVGIDPIFTVFHESVIERLLYFNVKSVKIASPDADKFYLLEKVFEHFDNIFISCGMLTANNYKRLAKYLGIWKDKNIKLFYCVSKYPTTIKDINFGLMSLFDGFSDHTPSIDAAKTAIDRGMDYIERHFTLGKFLPGPDHGFSSTPDEITELTFYRTYKDNIEKYKRRFYN